MDAEGGASEKSEFVVVVLVETVAAAVTAVEGFSSGAVVGVFSPATALVTVVVVVNSAVCPVVVGTVVDADEVVGSEVGAVVRMVVVGSIVCVIVGSSDVASVVVVVNAVV